MNDAVPPAGGTRPDAATLEQAAAWYLDLREAVPEAPVHQEHARWLTQHPAHRVAWERVQRLQHAFGQLPEQIGGNTFHAARATRRKLVKHLAVLLAVGGGVTTAFHHDHRLRALVASHRTRTGERRRLLLADGGVLQMNTATALDIDYGAAVRTIRLHRGEILVATAPDPQGRPFIVETRHGPLRALGTRFAVRDDDNAVLVQVLQHAVQIGPAAGRPALRVDAGRQVRFTAATIDPVAPLERHAGAWSDGMLMVANWRLDRVLAELARYHGGYLGCDPQVAGLAVSGMFHLDDIPGVLDNLAATLPVRIHYRTRYWIRVAAA